ncbi:MAG: type II secretion system F family protein [Candidatus Omnitrophica bacterium]|nr:type II secretion system F family protein [Candidatus Omnitrophota bacterium]
MFLEIIIFTLVFVSVVLIAMEIIPLIAEKTQRPIQKRVVWVEKELDNMFVYVEREKLALIYVITPIIVGGLGVYFFHNFIFFLIGFILGPILPTLVIKKIEAIRRYRLRMQLVDTIIMLSSALKSGMSLLQAMESVVEDMPPPIAQELGLIVRENKMGITFEESLERFNNRVNIPEVRMLVNAILVAKETGGDLTKVLSRLSVTIRDNQKIKEKIATLTLQGKIQGLVMSILPFVFTAVTHSFNHEHFNIMFETQLGRTLLLLAAALMITGIFLIKKFSTIKI